MVTPSGHNSSCEFQTVRRFPKFLWVLTPLHHQNPSHVPKPHTNHHKHLHPMQLELWEVQRLQDQKESGFKCPTTFCPGFLPGACTAIKTRLCQESQRGAVRSSSSHKIQLFSSKLPCVPEVPGKALWDEDDIWKLLPLCKQTPPSLLPMSKGSGEHLSAWRVIKVIIALLLTGIKLTAFQNHSRAISKALWAFKCCGVFIREGQSATHLTSTDSFYSKNPKTNPTITQTNTAPHTKQELRKL